MKVRIFQQHTHAGVTYPAGSEIDLPEDVARWLVSVGAELRAEAVAASARADKLIGDLKSAIEARK